MPTHKAKYFGLLALVAAALPVASQADTMDYSFAELAYVDSELGNLNGDGIALRGSLPVNPNFFVFAGYSDVGYDFNVDVTGLEAGAGGHLPLADKIDLVGRVGLAKVDVDTDNGDADDDGFLLGARVRAAVMPRFELEGGFDYVDVGDSDTSIVLEGRYFFVEQVAGGLRLDFGDEIDSMSLAVRVTF